MMSHTPENKKNPYTSPMPKVSVISPAGLKELVARASPASRVIPVDATWYMPGAPHDARAQFRAERLPQAAFFDLDAVALPQAQYPHMLPTLAHFNSSVAKLGIGNADKVVVYDREGIFSSPRAAWNFALYGHREVYLLDNFGRYKAAGQPLETAATDSDATAAGAAAPYRSRAEGDFAADFAREVIAFEELLLLVELGRLQSEYHMFDARAHGRFTGQTPEPRPELALGHVPSSLLLPFTRVLNPDNTFKTKDEIVRLFRDDFGVDVTRALPKGIIVSCGTGVTAVILKLAIESVAGSPLPVRVYDGSWTEWAQRAPPQYIVRG